MLYKFGHGYLFCDKLVSRVTSAQYKNGFFCRVVRIRFCVLCYFGPCIGRFEVDFNLF